jgi:hypothetical protein
MRKLFSLAVAMVLVGVPSFGGAIEVEPGEWRLTESGTDNGKPMSEVSTTCLTPEEAKNPIKALSIEKDMKGQCRTYEITTTPAGSTLRVDCGNPREIALDATASFTFADRRRYSVAMKGTVTMMGTSVALDRRIEAAWVAAECKK